MVYIGYLQELRSRRIGVIIGRGGDLNLRFKLNLPPALFFYGELIWDLLFRVTLLIKEGKNLSTMAAMKNVLAYAVVEEEFPVQCGIYDLNEFLGVVSLFDTPEIEFNKDHMNFKEGSNKCTYIFAEEDLLVVPPKKKLAMPEVVVEFELDHSDYSYLLKAASTMNLPDLTLKSTDGKTMTFGVHDKKVVENNKNALSNEYSVQVGKGDGTKFIMNFKSENMKILPGDYKVSVAAEKISLFENLEIDLKYYIALEPDSVWNI